MTNLALIFTIGLPPFIFVSSLLHVQRADVGQSRQYFSTAAGLTFFPVVAILLSVLSEASGSDSALLAISAFALLFIAPILTVIACFYFVGGHMRGGFASIRADVLALIPVAALLKALAASAGRLG